MIAKYDAWICGQRELMAALHQLRGGDLACWCAPEAYDGEKLLELASWVTASNGRMAICAIVARRSSARWPTGWPALAHSGQDPTEVEAIKKQRLGIPFPELSCELFEFGRAITRPYG